MTHQHQGPTMTQSPCLPELPKLPTPVAHIGKFLDDCTDVFDGTQMQSYATAYGLACYEAGSAAAAQAMPGKQDRCEHGIRSPHECRECDDLRHRIAGLVEKAVKEAANGGDTYMVGLCVADKIAAEVRRG